MSRDASFIPLFVVSLRSSIVFPIPLSLFSPFSLYKLSPLVIIIGWSSLLLQHASSFQTALPNWKHRLTQTIAKQSTTNTNLPSSVNWHVRSRLQSATRPCSFARVSASHARTHTRIFTPRNAITPLLQQADNPRVACWDFPHLSFDHLLLYCAQARCRLVDTHYCRNTLLYNYLNKKLGYYSFFSLYSLICCFLSKHLPKREVLLEIIKWF